MTLEIAPDCHVRVRAPRRMPEAVIRQFVEEKSLWLQSHLQRMKEKQQEKTREPGLTQEEIRDLADLARKVIPDRVACFAAQMGVSYGRITIRNQRTRWGSCSSKGNLNFNCLLMLAPPEVLDYVVVHELCHRREMNHSPRFWAEVENILPDYREQKRWLRENGSRLMARMTGE